jgi:copper chaperone CopZ
MQSKIVTIPAIHCGHCVMTIEQEVSEINGVTSVQVDEASKQAVFQWDDPASWQAIKALLEEIEYPAQELMNP